jgi:NADH-quinone oxidoreductase subunit K
MSNFSFIVISLFIFCIGSFGIFLAHSRKSLISILMSIELLLVAVNLNFFVFAVSFDDFIGQFSVLLVLTVAAAESALGLALIIIFFRLKGRASIDLISIVSKTK